MHSITNVYGAGCIEVVEIDKGNLEQKPPGHHHGMTLPS